MKRKEFDNIDDLQDFARELHAQDIPHRMSSNRLKNEYWIEYEVKELT